MFEPRVVDRASGDAVAALYQVKGRGPVPFIYLGEDVEEGLFPWFATVFTFTHADDQFPSVCGGVLFSPTTVVTAAHCVADAARVSIQLHETDPELPVFDHSPKREGTSWRIHPLYSAKTFYADIAAVTIDAVPWDPAVFPEPAVDDGSLWADPSLGYATVVGHGLTEENALSPVLQRVDVPRVAREDCVHGDPDLPQTSLNSEDLTWPAHVVFDDLCAGWAGGCNRPVPCPDSCSGDSGGPIMDPASVCCDYRHTMILLLPWLTPLIPDTNRESCMESYRGEAPTAETEQDRLYTHRLLPTGKKASLFYETCANTVIPRPGVGPHNSHSPSQTLFETCFEKLVSKNLFREGLGSCRRSSRPRGGSGCTTWSPRLVLRRHPPRRPPPTARTLAHPRGPPGPLAPGGTGSRGGS